MKISVIIATQLGRDLLQRTIDSLLEQDYPASDYEIIVVLDGARSSDAPWLQRAAEAHGIKILEQSKSGQAAAINRGLRFAGGDIVLFLDDDVIPGPDCLRVHAEAHDDPAVELAFGPILTADQSEDNFVTDWVREKVDGWFERVDPAQSSSGWFFSFANPNTSARRELLLASGGLDENCEVCNDTEFGLRLWKAGKRWRYLPEAEVRHIYRKTAGSFAKGEARQRGAAEVRLCRKHPEYRQFCGIADINLGHTWQRLTKRFAIVHAPNVVDRVLAAVLWIAKIGRCSRMGRAIGLRLLTWRYMVNFHRGAMEETGSWDALAREFCLTLPVLLYHRVGPPVEGEWHGLSVTVDEFRRQMHWLKESGWQTIKTSEWVAWQRSGKGLPRKVLLVTFDDGYKDTADNAYPLLRELGLSAVTFLVTDRLGKTTNWDEGRPEQPLMSAEDVDKWTSRGLEFEAHSCTHPDLTGIPDCELARELKESRRAIIESTGRCRALAYPYGASDERVREATRVCYEVAFEARAGLNWLRTYPWSMKRSLVMHGDSTLDLWFYLNAGWSPMSQVRFALRDMLDRRRRAANQERKDVAKSAQSTA